MLQTLAIQTLVVCMLGAVGLRLRPVDLLEVVRKKKALAVGLAWNLVLIPAAAFFVCKHLDVEGPVAVGIFLCAVAPGGPSGPVFTKMAGGHLGFGTALMVVLALVSVLTAPLTVTLLLGRQTVDGDLLFSMLRTLLVFTVLPLTVGMVCRRVRPAWADFLAGPALKVANGLLLIIIAALLVTKGAALLEVGWRVQLAMIGLVGLSLAAGSLAGRETELVRAVSEVTAVRSLSVALLLSASYFPDPKTDAMILAFGFYIMLMPGVAALLWSRAGK